MGYFSNVSKWVLDGTLLELFLTSLPMWFTQDMTFYFNIMQDTTLYFNIDTLVYILVLIFKACLKFSVFHFNAI